ncbi:Bax inhibitor-1/YccA family protein [Oxalobacter paraformigenes]|uniref:Bax inhibitor-1/YccA family protein n=1 Tax=Oxalobacter paraformigenes TaxID=556268 RepID=C3X573_9BURK|nr:Bax inhibitor-1/YccA family protein [Oxalobacter paraformigenes]EEO28359.1 hypothetical protein OFAG_01512 [Oxalobacter paraformigenes]
MNKRYRFDSAALATGHVGKILDYPARRVLRNTYFLLSLCLGFSALTAAAAIALQLPHPGFLITLIGYFGLLFLVSRNRNNGLGIVFVLVLTGFMGYTLGPIVGHYLRLPHGGETVLMALGGTSLIFIVMSGIALFSRRDFSFLAGFLTTGILVAFFAAVIAFFFEIPALSLAVSAVFVLLMSGLILYETNRIVRNGETNYVMATVTLFVAFFNLFSSLLHLLGFAGNSD